MAVPIGSHRQSRRREERTINAQRGSQKRHFRRYREIALILVKHRLREVIRTLGLERFLPMRWIPPGNPWRREPYPQHVRMRMALEELGTTFIKLGQILSTRVDLLPSDFARELTKLQSSLSPIPVDVIKRTITEELGRPVEEVFASFTPEPLGVASIGQVHAAKLRDGTSVVVKVRKPGVVEQVAEDLDVLHQLAVSAADRWEDAEHYDLVGIVQEITETLHGEMDYVREGRNAEYFASFFKGDLLVHIPKIFWEYTTSQVITMERIEGIHIMDVPGLERAHFNRKDLAKRSVNLWLKMVFEGGAFHADPHPGNLLVEKDGRLGLVDFGMLGLVDNEIRENLATAIQSILERDVEQLVEALVDLGVMRRESSREQLRADLKHVLGHYPDLSIEKLRASLDLDELFQVVRHNHVQLPANTFLLLKTVVMAQSLGKGLDPDFDIIPPLESYVKKLFRKKFSPLTFAKRLPGTWGDLAVFGMEFPRRMNRIVKSVERGELQVRTDVSGLETHLEHLEHIVNRLVIGLVISAIILGMAIVVLSFRVGR